MARKRQPGGPSRRVRDYAAEYRARNARARAEGFESYTSKRKAQGLARGLTVSQAYGHPRKTEPGASTIAEIVEAFAGAAYASAHVLSPTGAPGDRQLVITIVDQDGSIRHFTVDIRQKDELLAALKRRKIPPPVPGSYGLEVPRRKRIVYWTPRGRTYHETRECPAIAGRPKIRAGSRLDAFPRTPHDCP